MIISHVATYFMIVLANTSFSCIALFSTSQRVQCRLAVLPIENENIVHGRGRCRLITVLCSTLNLANICDGGAIVANMPKITELFFTVENWKRLFFFFYCCTNVIVVTPTVTESMKRIDVKVCMLIVLALIITWQSYFFFNLCRNIFGFFILLHIIFDNMITEALLEKTSHTAFYNY